MTDPKPTTPPTTPPPAPPPPKDPPKDKADKPKVPVDPATGEEYKKGEVIPGRNEPVGGEFTGPLKERMDRDAEDAAKAEKEANDRAEAERKRLEAAEAKRAKEAAKPAKKDS